MEQHLFVLKKHGKKFYVPAALRATITSNLIVTKSFEKDLLVYDFSKWKKFVEKIQKSDDCSEKNALIRVTIASAVEIDFSKKYVFFPKSLQGDLTEFFSLAFVLGEELSSRFQNHGKINEYNYEEVSC